jgi:hypothetical protein
MPPDSSRTTTPGREPETQTPVEPPHTQWEPVYDYDGVGRKRSLPIAWRCPCGGVVHVCMGLTSCSVCGKVPRDSTRTMNQPGTVPDVIRKRQYRKFAKKGY